MQTNQSLALRLALITVLMWSTVATAFKLTLDFLLPGQIVIVATAVSILVLASVYFYQRTPNEVGLLGHFRRTPLVFLVAGTINPTLYYFVLFEAYDRLPAQVAQPINYTWAIVLSLLAIPALKHKFSKGDLMGLCFSYLGVVILVTKLDFSTVANVDWTGVLLAILSTLIWALYWIINTKISAPPVHALLLCFICSLPSLAAISLLLPNDTEWPWQGVLGATYVGLFEMSLAFVFWLKAMRIASSTAQISSLIYLSPFISLFLIYFLLEEDIYPTTLLALTSIVIGLILQKKVR